MKPKPAPTPVGKMLAVGTKVAVLRPNLWAGAVGEVVKHSVDMPGSHVVLLVKYGNRFHALATIEELKEIKP